MTDGSFEERELKFPGPSDGIYSVDWAVTGGVKRDGVAAANPEETPKRDSGDKVAIHLKYCSNQLALNTRTFREALQKAIIT